tara:strand:- start:1875 stop:2006 length:132 start_codon:yes stop_codon:yes gene_type:complete
MDFEQVRTFYETLPQKGLRIEFDRLEFDVKPKKKEGACIFFSY